MSESNKWCGKNRARYGNFGVLRGKWAMLLNRVGFIPLRRWYWCPPGEDKVVSPMALCKKSVANSQGKGPVVGSCV